jgi:hypothetical protein
LGVKLAGMTAVIHTQTDYLGRHARSQQFDITQFTGDTGILEVVKMISSDDLDSFVIEDAVTGLFT